MKNIFIYIGLIILFLNSLAGVIFHGYNTFNWILNDLIIIANTVFLSLIAYSKQKDGFKISVSILFPVIGIVQLILGSIMEQKIEGNVIFMSVIILFSIQILLILTGKIFSKYA